MGQYEIMVEKRQLYLDRKTGHRVQNIRSHFLEAHEKRISGIVLIAVGLIVYFVKF